MKLLIIPLIAMTALGQTNVITYNLGDSAGLTNIPISEIKRGTNQSQRLTNVISKSELDAFYDGLRVQTLKVSTLNVTNQSITNAYSADYLKKWAESGELCAIRGHAWGEKQPCFAASWPPCGGHRYCLLCRVQQ